MTEIKPPYITNKNYILKLYLIIFTSLVLITALSYGLIKYYISYNEAMDEATNWSGQLADCLNGKWRGKSADGLHIGCLKAETFDPKKGY